MSSTTRTPFGLGAIDPWWIAVTAVSLVSLLLVSGWPDRAGPVSDGLMLGLVVTMGVGMLLYVSRQGESQFRIRQEGAVERRQALTSHLARRALNTADLGLVMQEATRLVAASLDVEYCAILESMADDSTLVLRAGLGWPDSSVGRPIMAPIDPAATPAMTAPANPPAPWQPGHAVRSGISVGLAVGPRAYGVLDVYSTRPRGFTRDEVQFVWTVADLLGAAIERAQTGRS